MAIHQRRRFARTDRRPNSWRPRIEVLEDRRLLTTFTVNSTADPGDGACTMFHCTLAEAITAANNNAGADTVTFSSLLPITIQLTQALPNIASDMTIVKGAGAVTIQGEGITDPYRIFTIDSNTTVTLSGLTITNGFSDTGQGGGIHNSGTLTVAYCTVTGNTASEGSGEIGEGGGIYNAGTLTVDQSVISENTAAADEATAAVAGGGIFNLAGTHLTVEHSTIVDNEVIGKQDSTISTVPGRSYGGGIYIEGGIVEEEPEILILISFSTISGNTVEAQDPGTNRQYRAEGGGIYFCQSYAGDVCGDDANGIMNISYSTIDNNLVSATFGDDECPFQTTQGLGSVLGGGMSVYSLSVNLKNTTITENDAINESCRGSQGGGIFTKSTVLGIHWSTISHNEASADLYGGDENGGGIFTVSSADDNVTLGNTIVANNSAETGPDVSGTLETVNYSLFSTDVNYDAGGNNQESVDPNLGPLQNNGGVTETRSIPMGEEACDVGSPAYNCGNNTGAPPYDQRGPYYSRIVDGTSDIGAFEVQAEEAPVAPPLDFAVLITAGDQSVFGKVKRKR